jgi:hypothetical protein
MFKRFVSIGGLGKAGWAHKRVLYDSQDSKYIIANQIQDLIKLGSWNLSSEALNQDLIFKAEELWVNFEKRLT